MGLEKGGLSSHLKLADSSDSSETQPFTTLGVNFLNVREKKLDEKFSINTSSSKNW